jgi:hypothetical protein
VSAGFAANAMLMPPVAVPVALFMLTALVPTVLDDCSTNEIRPSAPMVLAPPPTIVPPLVADTLTIRPSATWLENTSRITPLVMVVVDVPLAVIVFWVAVALMVPAGAAATTSTSGPSPFTAGLPLVSARTR